MKPLLLSPLIVLLGSLSLQAAPYYTQGPGDLSIRLDGDGNIETKFGLQAGARVDGSFLAAYQEFAQDELILMVQKSTFDFVESHGGRPAGGAWDPLGVPAGTSFWFLPETNTGAGSASALNVPFFGFSTVQLDPTKWSDIKIVLDGPPTGPDGANLSLYKDGAVPLVVMSTANGVDDSDSFLLAAGASTNYTWAFTEPGDYVVNFRILGTYQGEDKEGAATYTFNVVPEAGSSLLLAGFSMAAMMTRRRSSRSIA